MLNFLPSPIIGVLAFLLAVINVLFWSTLIFIVTGIKLIFRFNAARKVLDPILIALAENWITGNAVWMWLTQKTDIQVHGLENLKRRGWYLVVANHQSWVDIVVLQKVLNRRLPFLKFFLKKELARIPVLGQAWWALDFPFMSRHSKSYLKKHPEQAGKDLQATIKACQRFSLVPTSVMNFVEGTRFTEQKHLRQQSPYQYLLKPKAGGLAFAIQSLGGKFHSLVNVTIVFPDGIPNFWEFMSGQVKNVEVHINQIEIPAHFVGKDYSQDMEYRVEFQKWLTDIWQQKDLLLQQRLGEKRVES